MLRSLHPEIQTRLHPPTRAEPVQQVPETRQQQLTRDLNRRAALSREQAAQCIQFEQRDTNPQ
jgi:hypothetical protein